ncbi:MAG: OmpA family protein, partial [Sulfurimonas sp.]
SDYNYEVTPVIGYNIAEGNIDLDDYATYGGEIQYNGLDSIIKPELSVLYSKADYDSLSPLDTSVWRVALNGVYEYDKIGPVIPLGKVGFGYENMSDTFSSGNSNSAFADAGIGAKIPFTENIALKLEAVYMLKYNDARYDNNLALLVGLNIAFGKTAEDIAPAVAAVPVVAATVVAVDGDDDKDGVANSIDECIHTPAGYAVNAKGCALDDDKDGVANTVDQCPTTAFGVEVDAKGCALDDDNDGVINAKDICPNSPVGAVVNSDGCPKVVTLDINFDNDSYVIQDASMSKINEYAKFLTMYTNYSAKIVGYTSSRGAASYNQKLSENRANAVVAILKEKGVATNQLSSVGMGEANPVADNATSEGRAQNRRIEAELTRN